MNGSRLIRWFVAGGLASILVIAAGTAYFALVWIPEGCSRLSWKSVKWCNVDALVKKFRDDLPLGTSEMTVEAYLRRENIPFVFLPPTHPSYQRPIQISRNVTPDFGGSANGSLVVIVKFDRNNTLEEIQSWPNRKAVLVLED